MHPEFTPSHSYNYLVSAFGGVLFNLHTVGIPRAFLPAYTGSVGCDFPINLTKHLTSPRRFGISGFLFVSNMALRPLNLSGMVHNCLHSRGPQSYTEAISVRRFHLSISGC